MSAFRANGRATSLMANTSITTPTITTIMSNIVDSAIGRKPPM